MGAGAHSVLDVSAREIAVIGKPGKAEKVVTKTTEDVKDAVKGIGRKLKKLFGK